MASKVTFCKKCGSFVEESLSHCPHCNAVLEDEFEMVKEQEAEKKKLESYLDSLEIKLIESEIPYKEYATLKKKWANRLADMEEGITTLKRRLVERSEAYLYLKALDYEKIPEEYDRYFSDKEFFQKEKEGFRHAIKSLYHLNNYFELEKEHLKSEDEKGRNEISARMAHELSEAKNVYIEGVNLSGREKINFMLRYIYKERDVYIHHLNWTHSFKNLTSFHLTDKLLVLLSPEYLEEFRKKISIQFNTFFSTWSSALYRDEPTKLFERENILEKRKSEKQILMAEDLKKIRRIFSYSFKKDFEAMFSSLVGTKNPSLEIYTHIEKARRHITNLKKHKDRPEKIREDLENIQNSLRLLVKEVEREKDLLS